MWVYLLSFSCFFGTCVFLLRIFFQRSYMVRFGHPKIAKIVKFHEFFSRRRANAIPRPHDVMIVPVVLMQCSSHLGPAVHFFWGRRLWWCSEANRGGRKWFFAAYSRGEVKYTAYSCNLRWSFAGF